MTPTVLSALDIILMKLALDAGDCLKILRRLPQLP
jgi:hypothetical protein